MIIIEEEVVTRELIETLTPMFENHREELTAFKDIKLNVNVDVYLTAYKNGNLKAFMAKDGDAIVGYVAYFINYNPHYCDYVYAAQDVLYVDKSRRGAMIGRKLLKYADEQLLNKYNVNVVTQHVKTAHDIGPLLENIGYKYIEKIYMKRLK